MGQLRKNLQIPVERKKTIIVTNRKDYIKMFASVRDTGESIQGTYKAPKKGC